MAEVSTGLYSVLSRPEVYLMLQRTLGSGRLYKHLLSEVVKPRPGMRVLDIGCGPGDILQLLRNVDYDGFDLSRKYIEFASRRYRDRPNHRFWCKRVGDEPVGDGDRYDLVMAIGVLHHLDDGEVRHLCSVARDRLAPGGRFVTADCCLTPEQSPLARFLIKRDRGQNVRSPDGYQALAEQVFPSVRRQVRHDLMHIPYSHTIMEMAIHPVSESATG
jgi:SAM-dependent methyltransferase